MVKVWIMGEGTFSGVNNSCIPVVPTPMCARAPSILEVCAHSCFFSYLATHLGKKITQLIMVYLSWITTPIHLLNPVYPWVFKTNRTKTENGYLSLRITVPRVSRLRFIWQPSFNLAPADNAWEARSLPARSTKFCIKVKEVYESHPLIMHPKKIISKSNYFSIPHLLQEYLSCPCPKIHEQNSQ